MTKYYNYSTLFTQFNRIFGNQLYKNSFFLIFSNIFASILGFIFWILIARIYTTEQIGIATTLSSLVNLIATFSLLGLNTGLIRFLPLSSERNEQINSSILIIFFVSGVLALLTLLNINSLSTHLSFVKSDYFYSFLFILFAITTSLNYINDSIFIAYRSSFYVLIKTIIQNILKLTLPFVLIFMGAFGIFSSISLGVLGSVIYGYGILLGKHNVKLTFKLHVSSVKKIGSFSLGTYLAGLASSIPSFLLPIIIINKLSPTQTAYYFIAATTVNVLYMIPQAITQNLLVEGSYEESEIELHTRKASRLILLLLAPSILIMIFFGNYILLFFGKEYSVEGINLLRLLAISGLFVGINYILGTLLILFHHIKILIGINFLSSIIILISSIYLLNFGIIGVGYSTLITQVSLTIIYLILFLYIKKGNLLRFLF